MSPVSPFLIVEGCLWTNTSHIFGLLSVKKYVFIITIGSLPKALQHVNNWIWEQLVFFLYSVMYKWHCVNFVFIVLLNHEDTLSDNIISRYISVKEQRNHWDIWITSAIIAFITTFIISLHIILDGFNLVKRTENFYLSDSQYRDKTLTFFLYLDEM